MNIQTIETGVETIKVQLFDNGNYRLIDTDREIAGEIVSYRGIAQLELPYSLQIDYGDNARWIWCSKFWDGCFPTEQLLVLCEYE